jgi:hypothetical protein
MRDRDTIDLQETNVVAFSLALAVLVIVLCASIDLILNINSAPNSRLMARKELDGLPWPDFRGVSTQRFGSLAVPMSRADRSAPPCRAPGAAR